MFLHGFKEYCNSFLENEKEIILHECRKRADMSYNGNSQIPLNNLSNCIIEMYKRFQEILKMIFKKANNSILNEDNYNISQKLLLNYEFIKTQNAKLMEKIEIESKFRIESENEKRELSLKVDSLTKMLKSRDEFNKMMSFHCNDTSFKSIKLKENFDENLQDEGGTEGTDNSDCRKIGSGKKDNLTISNFQNIGFPRHKRTNSKSQIEASNSVPFEDNGSFCCLLFRKKISDQF